MQIKAIVIDDTLREYTDKKTNQVKQVRNLCLMDMDDARRMTKPVNITIPLDDRIAGKAGESSIRDCLIVATITDLSVLPWNNEIGFRAELLSIVGHMGVIAPATATAKTAK